MKYKAVLFDLDGTLLNTLQDLADSVNSVLSSSGFPEHGLEAYKYFVGDGIEELAHRALPEKHRDKATLAKCITAIREEYRKRWANNTRPYQGIPELLDALTARNIKLVILSNKPDDSTKATVSKLLSKWQFDIIMGASPSVPKKPNPKAALEIVQRLNIPANEFLYLGDSGIDMKTASAAGMYPVGALWGFRTAEELTANGAKALIRDPADLLALLP